MLEIGVIAFLAIAVAALLFVNGFFMGERNARRREKAPEVLNEPQVAHQQVPKDIEGRRLQVRSPREVIFEEQQKRDGIVPPAVAKQFKKDAEGVVSGR
jgi:threonine dehydrogenase-like Zn-dependent dehydrogenase